MASLIRGGKAIQFVNSEGKRKTISLARIPKKRINSILLHVEELNSATIGRVAVAQATANWLRELEPAIYKKLGAVGLVPKRAEAPQATLGAFLDAYIESRSDVKGSTATVYGHTRRCLIKYFGATQDIAAITPGDCDDWRRWLARPKGKADGGGEGLDDNTVRRRCGIAKQFFRAAVRKRLIAENPFDGMKGLSVRGNKAKEFFVSREMAERVIAACPDGQWRLLFALSRYGGLRCPSEHLGLRWSDIDWERNRMMVHSPKTEHFEDGGEREVPIFPEIREHLLTAKVAAEPETEFVITRYRDPKVNLRTEAHRIIRKAGFKPWPKTFQNLRSTRKTELAASYPIHVVCAWIGNTQAVAVKHYLQVTDGDFANAADCKALHKALQQGADSGGLGKTPKNKTPVFPEKYEGGPLGAMIKMGGTGLEPVTSTV